MSEQGKRIYAEMSAEQVDAELLRALGELSYTASETGVIPFALSGVEDMTRLVQLVRLAEKYRNGVPDGLRM